MSNLYASKPSTKPLKGGSIVSSVGTFDTISATSLKLDSVNIAGVFEDGILLSVTVEDSEINNTIIGLNGRSAGYFTTVDTNKDVQFNSEIFGSYAMWDSENAQFHIVSSQGSFKVDGCSYLGNIEICRNDIKATNVNGDINVIPNGGGTIYINGPFYQQSTGGNFTSVLSSGGSKFLIDNDFVVYSSHGSITMTSMDEQSFSTVNGDISINVDTGIALNSINNIRYTTGNINVTTSTINNLKTGDTVSISNGSLIGDFTVSSILSNSMFRVSTTTGLSTIVTGGSFLKYASNNIILNTSSYVKIPISTELSFGDTSNTVSGNSSGVLIQSGSYIYLDPVGSVVVPQNTNIEFGTSGNNYIDFNGNNLVVNSDTSVQISGPLANIDAVNTKFSDPILTIANYTTNAFDVKDRGLEFPYFDTSTNTQKLAWFGFRNSSKSFTFIPDAINNDEVINGTPGNFEYSGLSVENVSILGGGTIDMGCGKILNASLISGCSNNITITGSTNVTMYATNRISLASGTDILVPNNIPLKFGTRGSYIMEEISGDTRIIANNNLKLTTKTKGSIVVPVETFISFDGSSVGSQRIYSNTSGELIMSSNKSIYVSTTGGNVIIPSNTSFQYGEVSQTLTGNSKGLVLLTRSNASTLDFVSNSNVNISSSTGNIVVAPSVGDIYLMVSTGSVRIPQQRSLVFGTSNNITTTSDGNFVLTGNSSNSLNVNQVDTINLSATSNVNIPVNTFLRTDPESFIYTNSSKSTFIRNTNTLGSITISANTTNISSSSLSIFGAATNILSDNTRFKDTILTLSYNNLDTVKDRGIEYSYDTSNIGWFGRKTSNGRFTYYVNATNTNEVISGTLGDIEVSSAYLQGNLIFTGTGGSLDINCGTVRNVNSIFGCTGVLNLIGSSVINATASSILLNAVSRVEIPFNVPLNFGSSVQNITTNTTGIMTVSSQGFDINSLNVNIKDPIVSIGGSLNDFKDRGIEFKWKDTLDNSKVGFFGYKNNIGRFVFIKDGVNTNEVFSGDYGDVQAGNTFFSNIDLDNGAIRGVDRISGGEVKITSTFGNVLLTPSTTGSVLLPYNSKLGFGTTENSISSDSQGNTILASRKDITLLSSTGSINLSTSQSIRMPDNIPFYIGNTNETYLMKNTSGILQVSNSSGDISLTPKFSTGSVLLPAYNLLSFGSTRNSIYSDGSQLLLNGYAGIGIMSSNVTIAGNFNVVGTLTASSTEFDLNKYILPLGTYQTLSITNITNASGTSGNIRITTSSPGNFVQGDNISIKNSSSIPTIDGDYVITSINSSTSFSITKTGTTITTTGTAGSLKSNLTTYQGKDVGIQVNYWSTTGSTSITAGTAAYKNAFFGFKNDSEKWSFYSNATISNDIVTGTLGDIQVNKLLTSRISGFGLDGNMSAGSNTISGTAFQIGGGTINTTPIGVSVASTGRFTTLTNTVQASFTNVSLQSSLTYSIERYTLSSVSLPFRSPSDSVIVSLFSVSGVSYTTSSGTMPSTSIPDGTLKYLVCSSMGTGCTHTIHFGSGKIITPNPLNAAGVPTRLVFKRKGQSAQIMWDSTSSAWILLGSGCYVE